MMPDIEVMTTKGFNNQGVYVKRGRPIIVDELRARDLLRNGLIEDYKGKAAAPAQGKAAEAPENKQAPKPANKVGRPRARGRPRQ